MGRRVFRFPIWGYYVCRCQLKRCLGQQTVALVVRQLLLRPLRLRCQPQTNKSVRNAVEVEEVEEVVDELLVLLSVDQGALVVPLVVLKVVSDVNGHPLGAVSVVVDNIVEELLGVLPVVRARAHPQNLLQLPRLRPTIEIENLFLNINGLFLLLSILVTV